MTNEQNYPIEGTFIFAKKEDGKMKFDITIKGETNENGGILTDKLRQLIELSNDNKKPLGLRIKTFKMLGLVSKQVIMKMFFSSLTSSLEEQKKIVESDGNEHKSKNELFFEDIFTEIKILTGGLIGFYGGSTLCGLVFNIDLQWSLMNYIVLGSISLYFLIYIVRFVIHRNNSSNNE